MQQNEGDMVLSNALIPINPLFMCIIDILLKDEYV